jgi:hypothetical protein
MFDVKNSIACVEIGCGALINLMSYFCIGVALPSFWQFGILPSAGSWVRVVFFRAIVVAVVQSHEDVGLPSLVSGVEPHPSQRRVRLCRAWAWRMRS